MSTIHLHVTTISTPEQFVAGLTDFGPGRAKLFGNSANEYLQVHPRGGSGTRGLSRALNKSVFRYS
jgi:hypothetical protein